MARYINDFCGAMDEIDNRNIRELFTIVHNYFCREVSCNNLISLSKLNIYLNSRNVVYTYEELNMVLSILQCEFSLIVRNDTYSGKIYYQKLQDKYQDTSYSDKYYNFCDDMKYHNKRFVLIADTHIGNKEVQDFNIINNIYNYCSNNNINLVFHLGDLFDGLKPNIVDNRYELFEEQIKTFIDNYPNIDNIRTYSICGNHDEVIHGDNSLECYIRNDISLFKNIKKINRDKSLFNIYNRESIDIKFNDVPFRLGHRLYINPLVHRKILHTVNDIDNDIKKMGNDYSVCISGHLHKGVLYIDTDSNGNNKCFITVPSTSLVNINNIVGFNIELINNISGVLDKMIITELYCDNNYNIEERNSYEYKFNEINKVLKKEFK